MVDARQSLMVVVLLGILAYSGPFVLPAAAEPAAGESVPAASATAQDGYRALRAGDLATARRVLLPLAKEGNPEAQFYLGLTFLKGASAFIVKGTGQSHLIPGEAQQLQPPAYSAVEVWLPREEQGTPAAAAATAPETTTTTTTTT